jgi:hypothetical protein
VHATGRGRRRAWAGTGGACDAASVPVCPGGVRLPSPRTRHAAAAVPLSSWVWICHAAPSPASSLWRHGRGEPQVSRLNSRVAAGLCHVSRILSLVQELTDLLNLSDSRRSQK